MGDPKPVIAPGADDAALAPPPDAENPALIDARTFFWSTVIGAALFIGAVVAFIL